MKVVVDDKIPFIRGVLEPFSEVIYVSGAQIDSRSVRDADALLVRTRTKCSGTLLDGTNVRFIGSATIGYDHIDTEYCENHNIVWTNSPGCNSSSVMQYIVSALYSISDYSGFSLKNKTLGIVGVGNVGSKVVKAAKALGMDVLLSDPPRDRVESGFVSVPLERLLRESDIVTLHVPLNRLGQDKTYHLLDAHSLGMMKPGAWLINSSRGEVVDSQSLKKAVVSGILAGVVLDVWENEPDIDLELMERALISTPHIAGYSLDGKANGTAWIINSLARYFGLPLVNWYPENIPLPTSGKLEISPVSGSCEKVIKEVVESVYSIDGDSKRLKESPSSFESLRGNYIVRRDFNVYTVVAERVGFEVARILGDLGFRIV
jgi:erythronate-4-phosphate dehydrogenase